MTEAERMAYRNRHSAASAPGIGDWLGLALGALLAVPLGVILGVIAAAFIAAFLPDEMTSRVLDAGAIVGGIAAPAAVIALGGKRLRRAATRSEAAAGALTYPLVEVRQVGCTAAAVLTAGVGEAPVWLLQVAPGKLLVLSGAYTIGLPPINGFPHESFELTLNGGTALYRPQGASVARVLSFSGANGASVAQGEAPDGVVIDGVVDTAPADLMAWHQAKSKAADKRDYRRP